MSLLFSQYICRRDGLISPVPITKFSGLTARISVPRPAERNGIYVYHMTSDAINYILLRWIFVFQFRFEWCTSSLKTERSMIANKTNQNQKAVKMKHIWLNRPAAFERESVLFTHTPYDWSHEIIIQNILCHSLWHFHCAVHGISSFFFESIVDFLIDSSFLSRPVLLFTHIQPTATTTVVLNGYLTWIDDKAELCNYHKSEFSIHYEQASCVDFIRFILLLLLRRAIVLCTYYVCITFVRLPPSIHLCNMIRMESFV